MAPEIRLKKQNCSARADTHSRCRMSGAAGTAAAVFLTLLLAAALFAGAGAALVEITDDDYPVSFWLKEGGKYTLNTTPTDVGDVKIIYGDKQVYKIRNATELEQASGTDIYILTEDIYFIDTKEDASVIPTFSGVLIGNGHTIYNLTISTPELHKVGLISNLSGGTLNYVQLSNANITTTSTYVTSDIDGPHGGLGGLVGYVVPGTAGSNIIGCSLLHSDLSGIEKVGGLVGYANASLNISCCNVANCSISAVGRMNKLLKSPSSNYAAGLVGYIGGVSENYLNAVCCNVANCSISASSQFAGGLFGAVTTTTGITHSKNNLTARYCNVTNCIVSAGDYRAGGLISEDWGPLTFTNCTVTNCTVAVTSPLNSDKHGDYAGGFTGEVVYTESNNSSYNNCTVKNSLIAGNYKHIAPGGFYVNRNSDESRWWIPGSNNRYDENVIVDNSSTEKSIVIWNGSSVFARDIGFYASDKSSLLIPFFKKTGVDYYSYNISAPDNRYTFLGKYKNMAGFGYVFDTGVPEYKVTFYNKTGDEYTNTSVLHGFLVTEPEDPVEKGYTFNGWNISSASGTPFDFTAPVTKQYNLYANRTPSTTVITLVNYTGGSDGSITLTYGSPAPAAIQTPEKGDLEFAGWYNETSGNNGTGTQFISKDGVFQSVPGYYTDGKWENETAAMNLYANWTVKVQPTPQPTQQPAKRPSSGGGSSDKGTSVWLTAAPTQVPVNQTAEPTQPQPTVSLTQTPAQTPASPAPFAGILAGLGAAAALFGIRRK